jgi:hypothetical protein
MRTKAANIDSFWRWFRQAGLDQFVDGAEIADVIFPRLIRLDERLGLEVSDAHSGKREIIFTANGHQDLFSLVRRLVQRAPEMEAWKLTALKPAQGFAFDFSKDGSHICPADWLFFPLRGSDGTLGLRIFIPEARNLPIHVLKNILQTGVGEERLAFVAHLEYCHENGDVAENRWASVSALSAYIDLVRAKQMFAEPDPGG